MIESSKKPHLLLLRNGVFMSKQNINMGKYELLSRECTGDIFEKVFNAELKEFQVGRFGFKGMLIAGLTRRFGFVGNLRFGFFVVYHALKRHFFRQRYDFVVTYDPFAAGLLGLLVSRVLGSKLICEVNGNYGEKKTWAGAGRLGWLKYHYCRVVIPFVVNRTFATRLLYADQLRPFGKRIRAQRINIFHEYTPVLTQKFASSAGSYLLLMGSPWDVKGVDVLIKAYRKISAQFPAFYLKVVGWYPEPGLSYLKELAQGDPRIEIRPAVHYDEAMKLMAGAFGLVLPSRSEAMGRVLLEGMSYGKPVIASRVDGIPTYVKDGVSGILVEPEDVDGLAAAMARLFTDPQSAQELGAKSREYVRANLSEENYLAHYLKMLRS